MRVSAPYDRISNLGQFSLGFEAVCGANSVQVEVELSVLMESPPAVCEHHSWLFPMTLLRSQGDSHLIFQALHCKSLTAP